MDTQKRLEQCRVFVDDVLDSKIAKLDRVINLLQQDLKEMRDDVDLVARATANIADLVRVYFGKARDKAQELADRRQEEREQQDGELQKRLDEMRRQEEEDLKLLEDEADEEDGRKEAGEGGGEEKEEGSGSSSDDSQGLPIWLR